MELVQSYDKIKIAYSLVKRAPVTPRVPMVVAVACQGRPLNRLEEVSYPFAMMDMRGSGQSERPKSKWDYSVPGYAKDVLAIMDAQKLDHAVVLGYSHAAEAVVHLAMTQPERVAALILIEPGLFVSRAEILERARIAREGNIHDALRLALSAANPGMTAHELEEGVEFVLKTYGGSAEAIEGEWLARGTYDVSEQHLRSVCAPTLVIGGTASSLRGDVLRTAAAIPNASLFWLQGATHFPSDDDVRKAAEIINCYLAQL